jgi:hypothetical protein
MGSIKCLWNIPQGLSGIPIAIGNPHAPVVWEAAVCMTLQDACRAVFIMRKNRSPEVVFYRLTRGHSGAIS